MPAERAPVAGRQVDQHVASITQDARGEAGMMLNVAG
jgi:hypothetical protein